MHKQGQYSWRKIYVNQPQKGKVRRVFMARKFRAPTAEERKKSAAVVAIAEGYWKDDPHTGITTVPLVPVSSRVSQACKEPAVSAA
jgi:hypothetical protein